MSTSPEYQRLFDETHDRMQDVGSFDLVITVAATAAILGARKVLAIHGASPETLQVEYKAKDGDTPRTLADKLSGIAIKELIRAHYSNCRINEEETGDEKARNGNEDAWHVDPLDGTSSFAEGQRYSTVGIAVYRNNLPFAAAICHPFEKELVVAQAGKGTHMFSVDEHLVGLSYARQLEVSRATTLVGGIAYIDALFNAKTSGPKLRFMKDLVGMANNNLGFRMSGSNIDQQLKVAKGSARLTLTDAVGGFFDLAAGGLAIIEAGGMFTDENGRPVSESTQVAIGTNGPFHDDVLELARLCYRGYQGFR